MHRGRRRTERPPVRIRNNPCSIFRALHGGAPRGPALTILLAMAIASAARAEDFGKTLSIATAPRWVAPQAAEKLPAPAGGAKDSQAYLLLDYQVNVASQELYVHVVKDLLTPEGVQDGSSILIDYNPAYQRLILHHVRVLRDGKASSRLARDAVRLLQREADLESFVLDGSITASLLMKDVRPADRIDYAYTIRGRNPVFAGKYADEFSIGWHVPVARENVRVLCPESRKLFFKTQGARAEPSISHRGGVVEYRWDLSDLKPAPDEDDTPSWHIATPWIELTEFADWAEMRQWASALYPRAPLPAELEKLAETWRGRGAAPEELMRSALDWVQRNIRYLGIELGAGSYRPSAPRTVFARRFGDCKDQSYLLCALLRRLGIDAAPVLVNTYSRRLVGDMLPSPTDFNHVIVCAVLDGRRVSMDPTQTYQRGRVSQRYVPDYGYGLMVADGQDELLRFHSVQGAANDIEIVERFTAGGQEEPALLDVETTARGPAADRMREAFAGNRVDELAKSYLNYYANTYPSIEPAGELSFSDDEEANLFKIVEHYRLPDFWGLSADKLEYIAEFSADSIHDEIPEPRTKIRSSPLAVDHPRHVTQNMEIDLPEQWRLKGESSTFTNAAFELRTSSESSGRHVSLRYDYRSLVDEVPASGIPAYIQSIARIDDELGYRLTWEKGRRAEEAGPSKNVLGMATVLGIILLVVGWFVVQRILGRR